MNWEYALHERYRQTSFKHYNRAYKHACCWLYVACLYVCIAIALPVLGFAKSDNSNNRFVEYLAEEKTNLTIANNELTAFSAPEDYDHYLARKKQNTALLVLVDGKIANLEDFLAHYKKNQDILDQRLKRAQLSPAGKPQDISLQEQLAKINTLSEVNQKIIELINDNLILAYQYKQALQSEQRQLDAWGVLFEEKRALNHLNQQIQALHVQKEALYQKNITLQQAKKSGIHPTLDLHEESQILLNNQQINLIQIQIRALGWQKKLLKADNALSITEDVKTIQSVINTYRVASQQFELMRASLTQTRTVLDKAQGLLLTTPDLKKRYEQLREAINNTLQSIAADDKRAMDAQKRTQEQFKKQLSARQKLTEYHLASWPQLFKQFFQLPGKAYHYVKDLVLKVQENYVWQDKLPVWVFWMGLAVIVLAGLVLNRLLRMIIQDKERSRLTAHLYDGLLVLLQRNIPHLTLLALLMAVFFLNHIPFARYRLLMNLILVWLVFRTLILIARLVLLERISDVSGKDVRLYYRLKWLLLLGGWSTALMVFSRQLPLSLLLQDLFSRLFMVFLLALSIVIWKSKDVIPYLLRPVLKTKKRYVRNAMSLLIILIPLTVFTTALIGLVGYINFAWTLSRYQAYFLLVITGYVLARGLVFDALELLSEWMISVLQNGWLWIEVFLKPLDKMLRVLLLLFSTFVLFQLFGWYSDSWVMSYINRFAYLPLVNISGVHITFMSIGEFLILLFIFIWVAKWTREFCYRWLYRHARDAGIRNSLSVFTQYAVILIGGFITLRVLGLDFSGMSMILGGLAVGMGFGLRDFASNIIGGLMLLIERPVREGDLITLGEYEGRVAHIGIRSMRVSSWDNMEVLIPNAETFNKPFTNWTHQDSIVRTVIPVKVGRSDDPMMVQQLILDVLAIIPEILTNPPPQVFLKQIDDALIEFEVRYFINVEIHTRFEIRSKVLFAITAQFKAAGVKPPIPPLSVELKKHEDVRYDKPNAIEE